MSQPPDVGQQTLDVIFEMLKIDEPWSWRQPRGFSWIAHRLAQAVEASSVFESRGMAISRIISRVTVVEDVELTDRAAEKLVAHLNHLAVGSAYVYLPDKRSLEAILGHNVHAEMLRDRSREIGAYQILQLALAEHQAESLADMLRGKVARRQHPSSGERVDPDDMLNVVPRVYLPAGAQQSSFADEAEIEKVHQHVVGRGARRIPQVARQRG
ncbi:MAG: hypothetical protein AUG89_09270 [Acidobacteria bacterium 13_1_20CM_4_56_7]|nr:MAG: hypothetical protein AUG89_09270 [Acidobacteria bacterium 13_1_20CM_4_56_7]